MLSGLWIPIAALFAAARNNPPEPATSTQPSTLIHDSLPPQAARVVRPLPYEWRVVRHYGMGVSGAVRHAAGAVRHASRRSGGAGLALPRGAGSRCDIAVLPRAQIVQLPFDAYEHHIGLQYGLPVQHWGSWFGDWARSYGWAVASRDGGSTRYAAVPDGGGFTSGWERLRSLFS
jgi:hypothetical protein